MQTKYYATTYGPPEVRKVEFTKETANTVTVVCPPAPHSWSTRPEERTYKKRSAHAGYFDTFEAARNFLIEHHTAQVEAARRRLQMASNDLGDAKGLKEPAK